MPHAVGDSALIVNSFRARLPEISGDPFAGLWVTPEAQRWADAYAERVGVSEVLVHALRHRMILHWMEGFLQHHREAVLVNIGCGFSSYPHLLPPHVPCLELDTEPGITFKQSRTVELEHQGSLPPRTVDRVAVNDLNDPSERPRLRSLLQRWIAGRPSFVLLEGVLFYLKLDSIGWLYATLGDLQRPGDQIASTAFRPEEQHKPIFDRLLSYCRHDYRIAGFEPTTLPLGFFAEQPRYSLRDHRNPLALSAELGPELALHDPQEVLEEDLQLLEHRGGAPTGEMGVPGIEPG
jgi:hypothetical protein